jgi:hypothetical protein
MTNGLVKNCFTEEDQEKFKHMCPRNTLEITRRDSIRVFKKPDLVKTGVTGLYRKLNEKSDILYS